MVRHIPWIHIERTPGTLYSSVPDTRAAPTSDVVGYLPNEPECARLQQNACALGTSRVKSIRMQERGPAPRLALPGLSPEGLGEGFRPCICLDVFGGQVTAVVNTLVPWLAG